MIIFPNVRCNYVCCLSWRKNWKLLSTLWLFTYLVILVEKRINFLVFALTPEAKELIEKLSILSRISKQTSTILHFFYLDGFMNTKVEFSSGVQYIVLSGQWDGDGHKKLMDQ